MQSNVRAKWPLPIFAITLFCSFQVSAVRAQNYTVLHAFAGGADGAAPAAGLLQDSTGNLYGTTENGGNAQQGTIFKIEPNGDETVLYSFKGGTDGFGPEGSLIADSSGNLYGTTIYGGDMKCLPNLGLGCGTVFKVSPDGTKTTLISFRLHNGGFPTAGLLMDAQDNLYGTTQAGSRLSCNGEGCGTVFRISPEGTETVIHEFRGKKDGSDPSTTLIADGSGAMYGTTQEGGGSSNCNPEGCGTVFRIEPNGSETILHAFRSGSDGALPRGALVMDQAGNMYGTTYAAGSGKCGTIFEVTSGGKEKTLYTFNGGSDGCGPYEGLALDNSGNFYGTTVGGGNPYCQGGCGTVFAFSPSGGEKVLYTFSGQGDGAVPYGNVILDSTGSLYGTAVYTDYGTCNSGCGVVFKLSN